jgi:V/A-type H+-transporting ATPase subunit I
MLNPIFPSEVSVLNILLGGLILLPFGLFFLAAHSFNIFINSMGGFIHSMRLHFAEFFGKFYEGGGEKFTPFKVKRSYTISRQGGHFGS